MAPRAFRYLARGLTRSGLGEPCVVTLVDKSLVQGQPDTTVVVSTRCIFVRRQLPVDVELQVYVTAEPVISVPLKDLPRQPRAGDTIIVAGDTWKVTGGATDTGAGMCECPVKKT